MSDERQFDILTKQSVRQFGSKQAIELDRLQAQSVNSHSSSQTESSSSSTNSNITASPQVTSQQLIKLNGTECSPIQQIQEVTTSESSESGSVVSESKRSARANMTEFCLGGLAACCAGFFTNPLEVVKTRIQLQGELRKAGQYQVHYKNVFHAFYQVARQDGITGLQKGLVPAMWYQLFMNGVRLGCYQCLDNWGVTRSKKTGEIQFYRTVFAGASSGCLSALVGSPFYLIKTQLQARSVSSIAVGHQHPHASMSEAIQTIARKHGIRGMWRGASGSMLRVTVGSASQLASFAFVKDWINQSNVLPKDSLITALLSSTLSGTAVVLCMTPFDVVSTRLYNQPVDATTGRGLHYRNVIDCLRKIGTTEGLPAFYKGWSASLLRLGPHTVLTLVFWTEIRKRYFALQSLPNANATHQ